MIPSSFSAPVLEEAQAKETTSAEVGRRRELSKNKDIYHAIGTTGTKKAFSSYVALAASRGLVTWWSWRKRIAIALE